MQTVKPWWQSKTIIVSLIGAIFAIGSIFNLLPAELDQEQVIGAILAVTSVLAIIFRTGATTEVTR